MNNSLLIRNSTSADAAAPSAEAMSEVIDRIYRCVLDRDEWSGVLEMLCPLLGGCAISLNVHDLASRKPDLLVEYGTDRESSLSYEAVYGAINPLIDATLLYVPEGDVRTLYDTVDVPQFRRSRFYQEWVAPQRWGDWMSAVLIRSSGSLALLSVARLEQNGPYRPAQVEFLRLLTPHLRRATALGRLFDDRAAERSGLAALLDRIRVAAYLVDGAGRIAYANASGEALLADGSVLRTAGRTLVASDPATQRALAGALSDELAGPLTTLVATADGRRALSVLPPSQASGGYGIVLLATPDAELPLPGPLVAEAYGLTAAEIRVLTALLKRRSIEEIAADFGVTRRTVKAHLQKLFEKTGTRRQADLVAEVIRAIPPMRLF